MVALRLPSDVQYLGGRLHHRSSFMAGLYLGISCTLLLVVLVNFNFTYERLFFFTSMAIGLPLILLWGILLVELICHICHISFGFIFEFNPRNTLGVPQRAELLAFISFLFLFSIIFCSQVELSTFPIFLFMIVFVIMISPIPIYFSTRIYPFKVAMESIYLLIKGPIRFRHFFFGDALMSLTFSLRSPVFLYSIYKVTN